MRISPTFRISIGLVLLTLSILMLADLAGLAPDNTDEVLAHRKKISESLAIEFSLAAQNDNFEFIEQVMGAIVKRDKDILSAGLRNTRGKLIVQVGDHFKRWQPLDDEKSIPTQVVVPIYQQDKQWGTVEIHFAPLVKESFLGLTFSPVTKLLIFVALLGFAGYTFLMYRTLRYLDPSSIVPGRVQFALDALRSGVVLIDNHGKIVLANTTYFESHNTTSDKILGKKLDIYDWRDTRNNRKLTAFPWDKALQQSTAVTGFRLKLNPPGKTTLTYIVNCTPILDANEKSRGALVSFEDISKIQSANDKLRLTLGDLEDSKDKIEKQNQKLTVLATRDSMTGCLNRRSFFEQFDSLFVKAGEQNQSIACIMTDIDHFKRVNDTHGHLFGDQVIKHVAEILESESRSLDLICRYGGEEFCILMPNISLDEAFSIAERIRFSIEKLVRQRLDKDITITSSFGVSSTDFEAENPLQLVNQADQALYAAKQEGRNRVICWSSELDIVPDRPEDRASDDNQNLDSTANDSRHPQDNDEFDEVLEPLSQNIDQLTHRIYELETVIEQQSKELLLKTAYDPLTGLPNRVLFQDRLNQAMARAKRENQNLAVISLDIEAFKRIHDTLGNNIAEELIRKVSGHLTEILRSTDTIALLNQNNSKTAMSRLNVDEFGILITDLETIEPITWVIKRIFDALARRAEIDKHEISLNSHIGVSLFPSDGSSVDELLNNASTARYYASKQPEGARFQFYSPELNTTSSYQVQLESELSHALENNGLTLYYQPKVNITHGSIVGAEALLRWNHPSRGMIPPIEFIPVAERSGLISELGVQVLQMACRQAKQWADTLTPDICISVNLSPIQLRQRDLHKTILQILDETGLNPNQLELEITESCAISNIESALENTRRLQAAGIRISLDDFGTGFSSLSQLSSLPVDTLKIDRSFISKLDSDSDDLSIVAAIIAMSHKLGINVLAEGVETVNQLEILRKLKCDEIQGYLFSMPVPADEMRTLLEDARLMKNIIAHSTVSEADTESA